MVGSVTSLVGGERCDIEQEARKVHIARVSTLQQTMDKLQSALKLSDEFHLQGSDEIMQVVMSAATVLEALCRGLCTGIQDYLITAIRRARLMRQRLRHWRRSGRDLARGGDCTVVLDELPLITALEKRFAMELCKFDKASRSFRKSSAVHGARVSGYKIFR